MADATIRLKIGHGPGSVEAFRRQLQRPEKLLKLFGIAAASEAQASFDRQGLHFQNEWEPRYPSQDPPYVNIAGALMDLAKGPNIRAHRFENRPAVVDTGMLRRSLAPGGSVRVTGTFSVEVGSSLAYASMHQFGGEQDIPITQTQKDNLVKWYEKQKRMAKRHDREAADRGEKLKSDDKDGLGSEWLRAVMKKLGFILNSDSMHQRVIARPFIGMNDPLEKAMRKLAVDFYAGRGVA